MIELTSTQRRALRAKAHALHPVVTVGHHGLTTAVMREVDVALKAHGLIKIRVAVDDREAREMMLRDIANTLDAAPVQHLGKLLIVWRPQEEIAPPVPTPKSEGRVVAKRARPAREPMRATRRDDDPALSARRRRQRSAK